MKEADRRVLNAFASYCPSSSLYSWNCFWCNGSTISVNSVVYNASTDIYGYVGVDRTNNEVIVGFRGTVKTSFANWIADLDFIQTNPYSNLPNVAVHEGFWGAYLSIVSQFIPALRQATSSCPGCTRTVYSGHSLGGALAAIALMDAVSYYNIPQPTPVLYTFGQPRTGNSDWSQFMQTLTNSITRVVHNLDIVPHLPLRQFGYQHAPYEIWMEDDASQPFVVCNSSGEDENCSDGQITVSIPDHLMYVGHNQTAGKDHGCF
uniref:Fungal lipase-type domain-containing protein n=1 Tax=Arcella intermedia TaxID=1963864 RepID=A0A6B2LE76_9EUKA